MVIEPSKSEVENSGVLQPQDTIRHVQIKISAREIAVPENAEKNVNHPVEEPVHTKSRPVRRQTRPSGHAAKTKPAATFNTKTTSPPATLPIPASPAPNLKIKDLKQVPLVKPVGDSNHSSTLIYKSLAASVALLLLLSGYLIWLYRRKSKLHSQLAAQNEEMKQETAMIEQQSKSLEELNELKDKLFAIVSHDLRSPIGNLKAIMEMFQHEGMSVEQISEMLTEMVPSVENADMIISNLLNWAVNQRDGLRLKKASVCYRTMIDETVRSFTYPLNAKKISIENSVRANSCVFADLDQVRIIVRNLVSNAVKFVPVGGKIRFYTEECDECVVLAVEDNGRGLTTEEIHRIFESKNHLSKEGTRGEKGAGIGLMLCREMAALNDGQIYVQSVPGTSCTFYLKLPKSEIEVAEPIF